MKGSISSKIYFVLVFVLAFFAALNVFLPQGAFLSLLPEGEAAPPKGLLALINAATMFILYGGLGYIGLKLSLKLGYSKLWDPGISCKQRFLFPGFIGIGLGVFFVFTDIIISRFHLLGPLPHPPFPSSLAVSVVAAIGEEIIFRLFFIPFGVWIVSHLLLKGKWQNQVFWITTAFSALMFSFGHIPSLMFLWGMESISEIPFPLLFEIILLNGVLSLFAGFYFKKSGFLASVSIHFWVDVVWHVIWGAI